MPSEKSKTILFLTPYPHGIAPGQRFRFEQYMHELDKVNLHFNQKSFLDLGGYNILYSKGKTWLKAFNILKGFVKRILHIVVTASYDYVFIFREASPIGPPIFEWLIAKVFRKKIIYDFDDAIWLEDPKEKGSFLAKLKWKSKVKHICRWSLKVSVGNEYLSSFAQNFNANVILNPTTIDTELLHNPKFFDHSLNSKEELCIGWTGTHSTLQYLHIIVPALQRLNEKYSFKFRVISNHKPDFFLPNLEYVKWKASTEIEDLAAIDIGLMPLTDDYWSNGKCGFKALQYMSLEKPALVSPVGVNAKIVNHTVTGYHCKTDDDWYKYLSFLFDNKNTIPQMGQRGREFVENSYSLASNKDNFLSLFDFRLL